MFPTVSNEQSDFRSEVIETLLAHKVGNIVSRAYNRAHCTFKICSGGLTILTNNRRSILYNKGNKMFSEHYIDYFELPEMNNVQYLEIDDFEDYEYKNNIAYEFAVRNGKVLQSLEKFEKQFQEYEKEYEDLSHLVDHIKMDHFHFLQKAGFDLFAMTYWLFKKRAKQDYQLAHLNNDDLCKLCNNVNIKKENHARYNNVKPLLILFNPAFESGKILEGLSCKYIKLKGQNITEVRKSRNGRILYLNEKDSEWNTTGWSSEVYPDDIEDDILPSIRYSFKRAYLRSLHHNATFNLPVNLEMDKKLFIDYMTKIKTKYDRRKDIDADNRKTLEDQRKKYIEKSSNTDYEKKHIANATIMMYKELEKHKHRVFTTTDLFGDTYIHPEEPKYLGSLKPKKVKELLYIWDSLKAAETYNKNIADSYESYKNNHEDYLETNLHHASKERKQDEIFYKSKIKNEGKVLKELYKMIEGKEPTSDNHLTRQHKKLLDKLIGNLEYKFLI